MRAVALAVAALAVCAACAHAPEPAAPATPAADDAVVKFTTNVRDADVIFDGQLKGTTARIGGLRVEPGHHHLELRRDNYYSAYADLQLAKGEHETLRLDLMPILP
jgi:hypothetical protein